MKKFICVALVLLCTVLSSAVRAEVTSKRFVLDNGLTVIVNEMPSTPVAAVYAWVRTGSANEGKHLGSGITHFVEHMVFKGTARRGPGAIPEEAKRLGGSINASTSYDFTNFTLSLPRENFTQGLDLVADMMQNATFDAKEVERERDVILKEMRMINDRPERKLGDLVNANIYKVHPYRLPIIGRESIFKAITRDELADYYRLYYAPNNMVLAVSGAFTAEEVLPAIREEFGSAIARPTPLRVLPLEPDQVSPRFDEMEYSTDLFRVVAAYQGVPLLHRDLFALDLLAMALGRGESSRFYQKVYREKQLVQSIDAGNDTPMDRGAFMISFLMNDDRTDDVLKEVRAIISSVKKNGLRPDELAKIKRQVVVENVHARATAGGMSYRTAMEEIFAGDHQFSEKYAAGINAVTNDDIKRVAREYLVEERLTLVRLLPLGQPRSDLKKTHQSAGEVERVVLANGLTLLLKRDPALPLINVSAMFRAGVQVEPEHLAGLAALTGGLWAQAVEGVSPEELSRQIEARGGSVSSGSGKSTMALSMSFLSDDLEFALGLLEKFMKAPAFPQKFVDLEREQFRTAIISRKDSVMQTASKELLESLYKTHPFRRDSLGTEETLAKITRADVVRFFKEHALPSKMVVAVFGDIDPAALKADLERRLGGLSGEASPIKTFDEPALQSRQVSELSMDKEQAAVLYGFRAPELFAKDAPALDVAVNILTSSLGGRLFKRIRDELGKSYALGGYYAPGVDAGMINFYTLTTNESIGKVRAILDEELAKIAREPVSESELQDAKTYLKGSQARSLETLQNQGDSSARDELLGAGYDFAKGYGHRIDAVTQKDVQAVARQYLDLGRSAVVVVKGTALDAGAGK